MVIKMLSWHLDTYIVSAIESCYQRYYDNIQRIVMTNAADEEEMRKQS